MDFFALLATLATTEIRFNSYAVQYLNVSDFAAVQVATRGERGGRKTVATVQDPAMLIIGKHGLTVKARNKANTVKTGYTRTVVRLIDHDGGVQEFDLYFSA